jgi:hypothetical protein
MSIKCHARHFDKYFSIVVMFQYMFYTPIALPSCYILHYHTREDYPAPNHLVLLSSSAFEYRTQFAVFTVFARSTV